MAKMTKKDRRIALMESAVNEALLLFPAIEQWAFGEGGIVTPSLQKKFEEVHKKLKDSKSGKIPNNMSLENRQKASQRMRKTLEKLYPTNKSGGSDVAD